ncbi:MAG: hypothetical protein LH609_17715 [Rudanella sp.]|nr:hypothetical protein [Rudanella sp.]
MNQAAYHIRLATFLVLLLHLSTTIAQPLVTITNIRVSIDINRVKTQYDITGITSADSLYIEVESRSRGVLNASTVTGDVGTTVLPGQNKTIYWDFLLDGIKIEESEEIQVNIRVRQPIQQNTVGGGPINALLSVLAPGVGTIFVQPNRKVGLRPLITGAYAGLIIYGLVRKNQADNQYNLYARRLHLADYTEANRLHHLSVVASWTAVALLLTDVTYTFLKGRKNDKQKPRIRRSVAFNYIGTTPTVRVQFHF